MVNDAGLFDVEDEVLAGPARSVPAPVVSGSQEDVTRIRRRAPRLAVKRHLSPDLPQNVDLSMQIVDHFVT